MKHPETAALAKAARAKLEMTQGEFAAAIQSGKRTIADWEAGTKPPTGPAVVLLQLIYAGILTAKHMVPGQ